MNRNIWRTIQNSTWLLGGSAILALAFFLWIGLQIQQHQLVEKPVEQTELPVEPEKVRFSPTLGMMTEMVPLLDLSRSNSVSNHGQEFRGSDFIKSQKDRWFLHIMNVSQEDVIKNYLNNRPDRSKFAYFRYVESGQPEHYLLTYGSFTSVTQALEASKPLQFDLPPSVKVFPQRFSALKKFVPDDVGNDVKINNLAGSNKLYQVNLRSVPVPVEAPPQPLQYSSPAPNLTEPSAKNPGTEAATRTSDAPGSRSATVPSGNSTATPLPASALPSGVTRPAATGSTTTGSTNTSSAPSESNTFIDPFN